MRWSNVAPSRVLSLFRRRREDDLEEEMRSYFDMLVDRYVESGMTPEAARQKATEFYVKIQIVGTPDDCIQQIAELRALTGTDHVIADFSYGNMPHEEGELNMRLFADRGFAEPESDAYRGMGSRQQCRGARVVQPHHRHPAAQYPCLGGGVVGKVGMPVQMVFGDVEHHAGLGPYRRRPVQLEAGQLDGQQVGGRAQRIQHRATDVAAQAAA